MTHILTAAFFHEAIEEERLVDDIKALLAVKPTYGYRRVTAVLKARYLQQQRPTVNHKRIYRLMKKHHLLLSRYASKPIRVHEGKIVTLHSNIRWCSDGFFYSL